jgi:hypothetical protein
VVLSFFGRIAEAVQRRIIWWALLRPSDFVIGGSQRPYLVRWWLIPRNRLFNVYVHLFLRSDDDRALHDHPWLFNASWLLKGAYVEHAIAAGGINVRTERGKGAFKFRWGGAPHRVELHQGACWTLFITGPIVRRWGFHCPDHGWVPWEEFTKANDPGAIGRGCDA